MKKIFFVDPMSYNGLAKYDSGVFSNFSNTQIYFFASKYFEGTLPANVRIIKAFRYNKIKNKYLKLLSYFISLMALIAFTLVLRPKIIHIQWCKVPKLDTLFLNVVSQLSKAKLFLTVHNVYPHDQKFDKTALKRLYQKFSGLIVHESDAKQELINDFQLLEDRIKVIPHGYIPYTQQGSVDSELELLLNKENTFSFFMLGALSYYKGVDLLVDAWLESSVNNDDKYQLLLCGRASKELNTCLDKIKTNSTNIFIFNRFMSEKDLFTVCEKGDVAVFPYRKISQSGVLLSILAQNTPVLVNPIGGLKQPFDIGNIGWQLTENSVENICYNIESIVQHQSFYKQIRTSRDWDELDKFYDWQRISQQTNTFYDDVLQLNS